MKRVEITGEDFRELEREAGVDPGKYNYVAVEKGFSIRKGIWSVGTALFEQDAKLIVAVFNVRTGMEDQIYNRGTGSDPLKGIF